MKILELFSGTQCISKAFQRQGHETFTIDNNPIFDKTDWQVDVLSITAEDIIQRFGKPDVIWASPPCQGFSVAAIGRNWAKDGDTYTPKTPSAEISMKLVLHTLELIRGLEPKYFFIENPRGMLRKMEFMQNIPMHTVTYCQYGDKRMKPTDLWTNHPDPKFKKACKNGMPCHTPAPRGSSTGTQGLKNAILRAMIPKDLCDHISDITTQRG